MKKISILLTLFAPLVLGPSAIAQPDPAAKNDGVVSEMTLERPSRSRVAKSVSPHDRLLIEAGESVSLNIFLNPGRGKIRLEAPNGGAINHRPGAPELAAPATGQPLRVDFSAGTNPGRYTLEISQGNAKSILQFWVGPEPPVGRPGPALTFTGTQPGN